MIIRMLAWITRRPLVWLRDHDGKTTLSIAYIDQWGAMRAERHWPFRIRDVQLLPGGKTKAGCYVVAWKYATKGNAE